MPETITERLLENIIIFYLVITKILQFFGLISILEPIGIYSEVVDFIDIIVSFTGLGYVLYRVSLTDIFFGDRHKYLDIMLVISYFLLILNKFVEFSVLILKELCGDIFCTLLNEDVHKLTPFFRLIAENGQNIEIIGFYIGGISIIMLSLYIALKIKVTEPSILDGLHGENMGFIKKFITSFLVIVGFYVIFFNITMEWLTRVLDAPLILIAIFFYIFKIHKIGKSMESEATLFKISDVVESLTEKFVGLFHSKKTIFLGISLILVLHMVSDVGSFVIPYVLGTSSQYNADLGENHDALSQIFSRDKVILADPMNEALALFGYALNTFAIIFLMVFPAYMWYIIYLSHTTEKLNAGNFSNLLLAIFYSSLVFYVFLPTYRISGLSSAINLFGVDIQTSSILSAGNSLMNYFGISVIAFFIVYFLLNSAFIKEVALFLTGVINLGFFGLYVYNFFMSIFDFYIVLLQALINNNEYFIGFYLVVFLVVNVMFYVGGYISFVISSFK